MGDPPFAKIYSLILEMGHLNVISSPRRISKQAKKNCLHLLDNKL